MKPDDGAMMRAGDSDRQKVADALRIALDEGRLSLSEYDERVHSAFGAMTYADLNALLADLPPSSQAAVAVRPHTAPAQIKPPGPVKKQRPIPLALSILWTIWAAVAGVNVLVWIMVDVQAGEPVYPWPIWVIGPPGIALLAVTVGVVAMRGDQPGG